VAKRLAVLLLAAAVAAAVGCASTGYGSGPGEATREAVRDRFDQFLRAAAGEDYDAVRRLVLPGEREGQSGLYFVERAFRMERKYFEVIGWDRLRIKVTTLKEGPGLLATAVVTCRLVAENEVRPVFVNLRWRKRGGTWYVDAFPES